MFTAANVNKIIGKPVAQAEGELAAMGFSMRIVSKDGQRIVYTNAEFQDKRVNVTVEKGIVTKVGNLG